MKARGRRFGWAFKRGRRWHVRYRENGRLVQRTAGTKRSEALALLKKISADIERAKHLERMGVPVVKKATLAEVWEAVRPTRAARLSARGLAEESRMITRAAEYFGGRFVGDLRPTDVDGFLTHLASAGCGPSTRNRYLSALGPVLEEAVGRGFALKNPARGVRRHRAEVKPIPFLSAGDVARIVARAPQDLRVPFTLLSDTGMRRGELLDLQWPDVDLGRGVITVRRSKNGRPREIPLTTRAREALTAMREVRVLPLEGGDPVFRAVLERKRRPRPPRKGTKPLTDRERAEARLSVEFRRAAKRAGFPSLHLHSLRHGFCSRLVQRGVGLNVVAALAGHLSLVVTSRYAHHAPGDAGRQAIRALEAPDGEAPRSLPARASTGA